jgi:hypothetical protein
MGTKSHICAITLNNLWHEVGRLKIQKLRWPLLKGLEYECHLLWWWKWLVVVRNSKKSAMANIAPLKISPWWVLVGNAMLVTSFFWLQWVKYKGDSKMWKKHTKKTSWAIHLFILEHHLFEQRTYWQCWFAKQHSQGGGQWHTYCHGPQICNLLW